MKLIWTLLMPAILAAADPTFLRRSVAAIQPRADDLTAGVTGALYRPIFGAGDPDARQLKGIARYGELTVEPHGSSAIVSYPAEEQIYFILSGEGVLQYADQNAPVKPHDFMYLPVGVKHGVVNVSSAPLRLLVMGFKIPRGVQVAPTPRLMLANADDVTPVQLASHGPTCVFKLLMGTTDSTRDKLAAANQMASLFIMEFAPGGTNIPHHHESEEEIYYVLQGHGDMVAGGGADGNEGRYPAKEGDAYFFRLNTTVGFYSLARAGEPKDLILAVRSRFPRWSEPRYAAKDGDAYFFRLNHRGLLQPGARRRAQGPHSGRRSRFPRWSEPRALAPRCSHARVASGKPGYRRPSDCRSSGFGHGGVLRDLAARNVRPVYVDAAEAKGRARSSAIVARSFTRATSGHVRHAFSCGVSHQRRHRGFVSACHCFLLFDNLSCSG